MAEKPEPPKGKKFDAVEDAHFRLDEHAREIDAIKKAGDGLPHALLAMVRSEIDKAVSAAIEKFKREDKAEDRKMIAEAISKALDREETVEKHGTVETPDGVHKMHIVETRKRPQ